MRACGSTPPRSRSTSATAGSCTTCCATLRPRAAPPERGGPPVSAAAPRPAPARVAGLAVFDLDGTISRRGTLAPYVIRLLARRPWRWLRVIAGAPALAGYLLGRLDRGVLKAKLLEK